MAKGVAQTVEVVSGFGYGVVGADLHVRSDGVPVYLLLAAEPAEPAPDLWLRQLPSRMLNARQAVVPFTGRETELGRLRSWTADGDRLRVCWLHGAGGQGKTRLAAQVAAEVAAAGWLVVEVVHGPGSVHPPPGSQDLTGADTKGLLLVVDYADRWPVSHLTCLLANTLLHRPGLPTRVLLVGRTSDGWPALRAELAPWRVDLSSQLLEPLPFADGARARMFECAHDGFAARYGLDFPAVVAPAALSEPEMGLTLAVHMAALVAVDAAVHDTPVPSDLAGLTMYLLDRENLHWASLAAEPATGHFTQAAVMNRMVFAASLMGTQPRSAGTALAGRLLDGVNAERAVADHAVCYPAGQPDAVFEPLYPDRLAEDFIALTLVGHEADYPAQDWAGEVLRTLCARAEDGAPPLWLPRAVTTLAAALSRWPHVGSGHVFPLLRADPLLAVEAGGTALAALAAEESVDEDLLAAVEPHLPRDRHVDLDGAALVVVRRLVARRLAKADDTATRAELHEELGYRLSVAGVRDEALTEIASAVALYREAAAGSVTSDLAHAVQNLCFAVHEAGRPVEALALAEEAAQLCRALCEADQSYEDDLAYALHSHAMMLAAVGRYDEAVAAAEDAVGIYRRLVNVDAEAHTAELAGALDNLSLWLNGRGEHNRALTSVTEAVELFRRLAAVDPDRHLPELAGALTNHGIPLDALGRDEEAVAVMLESAEAYRKLAAIRPAAFEHHYATALSNVTSPLQKLGRHDAALECSRTAVRIRRQAVEARPGLFEPDLASALNNMSNDLLTGGLAEDALAAAEEALALRRVLVADHPHRYTGELASAQSNISAALLVLGQADRAAVYAEEALATYRRLRTEYPGSHAERLAAVLSNLAGARVVQGQPDAALALLDEAVAVAEHLPAIRRRAEDIRSALLRQVQA